MVKRSLLVGLLALFLPLHSAAQALEKVTFASVKLGTIGFITHIAKVNRLDEQNGLDLDLKFFTPTEGINAFLFKKVDAGFVGIIPALRANAKGSRVRLLAPMLTSHFGIITSANAPYRTVDELKGKKVGTLPRVSGVYSGPAGSPAEARPRCRCPV
ncbi:MAG: ABC transporter substrate-binding protein [Deltaproteobacteria bacterium]|nr:ABC transporter substrate-binding protein [Deltaproteobacteria bacterium]